MVLQAFIGKKDPVDVAIDKLVEASEIIFKDNGYEERYFIDPTESIDFFKKVVLAVKKCIETDDWSELDDLNADVTIVKDIEYKYEDYLSRSYAGAYAGYYVDYDYSTEYLNGNIMLSEAVVGHDSILLVFDVAF